MKVIQVCAALIECDGGQVLLAQRQSPSELAGLWEFPGGKIEANEAPQQSLQRELKEELGVEASIGARIQTTVETRGDRRIEMQLWRVDAWRGEPRGMEGQAIRWVSRNALDPLAMPPIDQPMAKSLALPREVLITPECLPGQDRQFVSALELALQAGVPWVQLRSARDARALRPLAREVRALTRTHGARASLNAHVDLAQELDFDGVHIKQHQLFDAHTQLASSSDAFTVGASCHSIDALRRAECLGVNHVFLSPVFATATHPNVRALGWHGFRALLDQTHLPAFALGGMSKHDLPAALQHGALGIAAIRGLWPVFD